MYVLTEKLPAAERYGLASQMRRAAVSVPSNIAEGQARRGSREFLHFLSHANGSLAELDTQLLLSVELGFFKSDEIASVTEGILEVQKMIAAIRRKLSGTAI
jgi:four helix bundle protein